MRIKVAKITYNFAVDGGTASTITPAKTESLPAGAIVLRVFSNERTPFTSSGSATVLLQCGSTALTSALAYDTGFTGAGDTHALASSAEAIELTAKGDLKVTIGTAALTAGVCDFYVEYVDA